MYRSINLHINISSCLLYSIIMDEICVRANLALENKKFVQDLEVSANPGIEDELEDEYTQACVQVDKVTLKLLFNLMKEEKLENAYDLAQRLHLEKSLEVASKGADRVGQTRLSDRIHDLREMRFPVANEPEDRPEFDDDDDDDEQQYDETPQERVSLNYKRVSPDIDTARFSKRREREVHLAESDVDTLDEPEPEPVTVRRRLNPFVNVDTLDEPEPEPVTVRRRVNPFAKNHKESPPKEMMESPRPKQPTLSRMSTFTAESRQKSKLAKHFL